jgi:2-polyprenyl-3-methyl-5-hydroxy-6-metoxy-1,4-benzoquinol methylase
MGQNNKYSAEWTANYYNNYGENEWTRFKRRPVDQINLFIHTHYLRRFVKPGVRVLEIGAGPGRFTQILADLDCRILVADLSEVQLKLHKKYAEEFGFDSAVEKRQLLDICDLSPLDSGAFDVVVAYGGPLSYVFERAGKALQECVRVAKVKGYVLASVMSLWGSCHMQLENVLDSVPTEDNRKITNTGDLHPENWAEVTHRCHLFRSRELRELAEKAQLRVVAMSASNCLSINHDAYLAGLDEDSEAWQELLRMELEACSQDGCLDMGSHIILVGQKRARE